MILVGIRLLIPNKLRRPLGGLLVYANSWVIDIEAGHSQLRNTFAVIANDMLASGELTRC